MGGNNKNLASHDFPSLIFGRVFLCREFPRNTAVAGIPQPVPGSSACEESYGINTFVDVWLFFVDHEWCLDDHDVGFWWFFLLLWSILSWNFGVAFLRQICQWNRDKETGRCFLEKANEKDDLPTATSLWLQFDSRFHVSFRGFSRFWIWNM